MRDAIICGLGAFVAVVMERIARYLQRHRMLTDMAYARVIHEAMMEAPHDGLDYRMARAAITAISEEL